MASGLQSGNSAYELIHKIERPIILPTSGVPMLATATDHALQRQTDSLIRERLHDFFFEELRRTYGKLEKDPRALEMAQVIAHQRPHFANWMLATERKILVELLEEAERSGEFTPPGEREEIAEMIQSATMKFRYPQLWSKLTLPKLERELEGVLRLLIEGLCSRLAPRAQTGQQTAA